MSGMPGRAAWEDDCCSSPTTPASRSRRWGGRRACTSARYAGVDGPGADAANYARLLRELAGFAGPVARRARFVCSVVAVAPDMTHYAATGHWWGAIAEAPRGEGGFGYDPVFVPEGSDLSVAEWPQEAKDQASHRALAGRALVDVLRREGLLRWGPRSLSRRGRPPRLATTSPTTSSSRAPPRSRSRPTRR